MHILLTLHRASSGELIEVVKFMLSRSPNQPLHNLDTAETPLLIACRKSLHDIAEVLLEHSPRLLFISEARNSLSPLHVACSRGDARMVELLLQTIKRYIHSPEYDNETAVSLDFRDQLGRTPLYNACYYGFFDISKLLIEFQRENSPRVALNVNSAVKNSQRTPLHVAVRKGSLEIVRLLLTVKGIDINVEGRPSGRTQSKLIELYQKNTQGHTLPDLRHKKESIQEEDVFVKGGDYDEERQVAVTTPDFSMSPPGTRTPDTLTSWSNMSTSVSSISSRTSVSSVSSASPGLHIDDSIGFMAPMPSHLGNSGSYVSSSKPPHASTPRSYSTVPKKRVRKRSSNEPSPPIEEEDVASLELIGQAKKRSMTDAIKLESGQSNLVIYENQKTGKLEFQSKVTGEPTGKEFDLLFMTPLAEACACYHTKIMRLLLLHGARDDGGLACRLAHLIQRHDLIKLILSYHTALKESFQMSEDVEESLDSLPNLELNWSHLKLPICGREWVGAEAEYYPPCKDQDSEFADNSHSSEFSNALKSSPDLTLRCDAVRVVHLENNQLMSVPIELFQLQNVQKINISSNRINYLPTLQDLPLGYSKSSKDDTDTGGWLCPFLTELNVSRNELTHVPVCIWGLPNLSRFLCSRNKLETILPEQGAVLEDNLSLSLAHVDFTDNTLKGTISRFLFELLGLRVLNLSNNMITDLPETVWGCDTLQDLNLSSNRIKSLPWCEPEHAYRDSSYHQSYSQPIPMQKADKVLVGKVEVQAPKIDRNKSLYQRAPSTIRQLNTPQISTEEHTADYCAYSALRKLNLSSNQFSVFPEALACFAPNLTDLDVSRNPLKEIDVHFLPPSLKKLTAKNCEIVRIGNAILKSHQVQIQQNCRHGSSVGLACQHRSHTHLPNLATLDLSNNGITYMQLVRRHPKDDYINFGEIEKEYDPKVAPVLDLLYPALEGLNLMRNNLLGRFNPNIGHQTHLKWIRLNSNHGLQEIPMEFAFLKNTKHLTQLCIDDLPNLVEPPPEYQQVELSHLLTYMKSRLKE